MGVQRVEGGFPALMMAGDRMRWWFPFAVKCEARSSVLGYGVSREYGSCEDKENV